MALLKIAEERARCTCTSLSPSSSSLSRSHDFIGSKKLLQLSSQLQLLLDLTLKRQLHLQLLPHWPPPNSAVASLNSMVCCGVLLNQQQHYAGILRKIDSGFLKASYQQLDRFASILRN
jgi:hypothetical protein